MKNDQSMRVGEGMRTFRTMKSMWSSRSVNLNVKNELYERIDVPAVKNGFQNMGYEKLGEKQGRCN